MKIAEVKEKVKVPHNRPEGPERGRGIALLFLHLGARRGWVVSTTPRPLYPRERPGTHCAGGWVGPRTGLDVCEKSRPPTGIRSPDRPARSQSLYRLKCGHKTLKKFRKYKESSYGWTEGQKPACILCSKTDRTWTWRINDLWRRRTSVWLWVHQYRFENLKRCNVNSELFIEMPLT
jgi:hypothetical protein